MSARGIRTPDPTSTSYAPNPWPLKPFRYGLTPCISAALLPPFFDQKKGLTAPSMSVVPTARFGATAHVSRDTWVNVPFQQW